ATGAADRLRAREGAVAAQRRDLRRHGAHHRPRHARMRAERDRRGARRARRPAPSPGADRQRPHQAVAAGFVSRRSARAHRGRGARAGRVHALMGDGRSEPRLDGEAGGRLPSQARPVTSDVSLGGERLTEECRGWLRVKNVALRVRRGTIHALIGPNGAGKTTCFNLLTHFLAPTAGRIRFNDRDITGSRPAAIARMGLVRSFQISAVFPHLSVLENVRIALQRGRGSSFDLWRSERGLGGLNPRGLEPRDGVGPAEFTTTPAVELPYGRKRALEIATTLALDPEMMLLDEPTAGMTHEDVDRITALIKRVAVNRTVLMVEHNLAVVETLSNTITVLARGEVLAEGDYASVSRNPQVIEAYMGSGHA